MRLVVIGGVAAGLSAAARARRLDRSLEITVLERGPVISYGACGLPYYIEGQIRELDELVVFTPERFSRERNIQVRTGANAVAIRHSRRQVLLEGGEAVPYDRLVIATGARPDLRSIQGANQTHVFTLHTLDDARRLRDFLTTRRPRRAVVVGAGYIGLEVAGALRAHDLEVSVVHAGVNVLGRHDPELTAVVSAHLKQFHIELYPAVNVQLVEPDQVAGISCDLVVLATGLQPNTEIARDAGIETGRSGAIRVNERVETNLSGVFAAGDCAETVNLITGQPAYLPLGTTANKMGRVAGANAAGARERFPGIAGTSIVRLCGLGFGFTGLSAPQARQAGFPAVAARIEDLDRARYFGGKATTVELVAERSTGRLLGGCVTGHEGLEGRVNVIAAAVTRKMTVEEFSSLDLAYAPPYAPVWDPLLIAAQQLEKLLH